MAFPTMFVGMISQSAKCITTVQSMHNIGTTYTQKQPIFKSGDVESSWDEYYSIKK